MFSLSPFSPVQLYEQVQPAPRVGRASERPFTTPEQDSATSRKREQTDRSAAGQEQALRGFGASATLLSSALLAELGRQMGGSTQAQGAPAEKESQGAALDKKRKSVEDDPETGSEGVRDASEARETSSEEPAGSEGLPEGLRSRSKPAQNSAPAQSASVANEDTGAAETDLSAFLVRLQRAKSVYAQGQMASGDYAFVRTAEVFQMVA